MFNNDYFTERYFLNTYFASMTPSDVVAVGTCLETAEVGSVVFIGPGPTLAQDRAHLSWDHTRKVLAIGSASIGAASGFAGPGAGLTGLNPGALTPGTAAISITGNAATVSAGVYTTGAYANPSWITALAGSKITGNIAGNAANVTGVVAVGNGGTGQSSYTGGQLLIGKDDGMLARGTLTAGPNIRITNGDGAITIAAESRPGGSPAQVQFNQDGAFGGDVQFVWDPVNKRAGIGGPPVGGANLTLVQDAGNKGLYLTGQSVNPNGGNDPANGVCFRLNFNSESGPNRQLMIGPIDAIGSASQPMFRMVFVAGNAILDAVSGDGSSRKDLVLGTDTTSVGFGTPVGTAIPSNIKVYFPTEARKVALAARAAVGQTANLQEWQDSSGRAQLAVDATGRDLILDGMIGTRLGTSPTQKLGFWGATPTAQPAAVANAKNSTEVTTQLNALLARLRSIGLIAP